MGDSVLTREGLRALQAELERLSTSVRAQLSERVRLAGEESGDPADEVGYLEAKRDLVFLEQRIRMLEGRLEGARVVDPGDLPTDVVAVGAVVRLRDLDSRETIEARLVGSAEAAIGEQVMSDRSPVGQAILGRKKGETVEVATPGGRATLKITAIKAA